MFGYNSKLIAFFGIFLLLLPACQLKRGGSTYRLRGRVSTPIFIEMPQNNNVFENVSGLIYESLVSHFQRIGYKVLDKPNSAYSLQVIIKSLEPIQKYVSPDILLFHSSIKLVLSCQLLNYRKEVVAQKDFNFDRLVSRPKNPVLNSDFLSYEYKRLMLHAAPKIEQYFRKFLYNRAED